MVFSWKFSLKEQMLMKNFMVMGQSRNFLECIEKEKKESKSSFYRCAKEWLTSEICNARKQTPMTESFSWQSWRLNLKQDNCFCYRTSNFHKVEKQPRACLIKNSVLKFFLISQENIYVALSFSVKLQASDLQLY